MNKIVAGLAVGKQDGVVAVARGPGRRCPHTGAGLTAGRAWGREPAVPPVVCDATGGDARGRGHRVRTTERAVGGAPPTKGRAVARAVGQGAKTDPLDAQIVAPDGEVCARPGEAAQAEAREAGRARRGRGPPCLDHRTQELHRLEKGGRGPAILSAAAGVGGQRAEAPGGRVSARAASPAGGGRARGRVSAGGRGGGAHRRPVAGVCAGMGPRLRESADGLGRGGAMGAGQWAPPGVSGASRWAGAGAPGLRPGGVVREPHAHGPGAGLAGGTAAGPAGQRGGGGGEADAAVAAACECAPGDAMGRRRGASIVQKG